MLLLILQSLYFFLPAYFANMAPVIMKNINFLAVPLDNGKRFNGKPLLGKNKTYRGVVFAIFFALIVCFLQYIAYGTEIGKELSIFDYGKWYVLGPLIGFGAIVGDSIKSFFKRRLNIAPGKPFIPFDQLDFVFGGLVLSAFVVRYTWQHALTIVIASFFLHIVVNHVAFYTGIRKEKW